MSWRATARAVLRGLMVALFVAASAVTLAFFYLRSSVQTLGGTIRVSGLSDPVAVVIDSFAIPHLYAA
ncbi:MAG: hypothetical protein V3W35_09830, partial [Gemmatimonadota bacterium]